MDAGRGQRPQARVLRIDQVLVWSAPLTDDVQVQRLAHVAVLTERDPVYAPALPVDRDRRRAQVEVADAAATELVTAERKARHAERPV